MKKNIIYIIILIILSVLLHQVDSHQIIQVSIAFAWCITGFLLLKNILQNIIK